MLFNSLHFVYFFIVVTTLYFIIPHKLRWFLLLIASCYFYMAFLPIYILILGFTIVIDYFAGIYIELSSGKKRKLFLICSLVANIGVLCIFKYYNFLNDNLSLLLNDLGYVNHIPNLSILLPIGLSFHTFQAMSYTIEVYRGNQKAERNFGIYSLYVMFYPQLVAGPIERPQNILHQFYEKHKFSYDNVTNGLKLMTWGFFKKIVISDRLADLVNQAYSDPHRYQGFPLILSTIFFAFQIYCDFSGYSDIAIGAARVMGFDLMRNFNKPYSAKSIVEFWQRWHISLSTWFRDYLYIPLGGSRVKMSRRYLNLLITFLISGLWHGANWTYIVWGGLNGVYQIIDISTKKFRGKIESIVSSGLKPAYSILCQLVTFLLICTTWVFFRARSVQDGWYIVSHFITSVHGTTALYLSAKNMMDILFALIALFILFGVEYLQKNLSLVDFINRKSPVIRWGFYYGLVLIIFLLGKFEGNQQFIYFQF